MRELGKYLLTSLEWLLFIFCAFVVVICIMITFSACSKPCESVPCPEKIVKVNVPVPQKCDFILYPKPKIDTNGTQAIYQSITELALDGVEIRKELDLIPCLNLIYKAKGEQ